jgi:hypothetical protein
VSYLERLKAGISGKWATQRTDKTDKSPSVSFVSAQGRHFSEIEALPDPAAEARRQRVLALLAADPARRMAVVCDGEGDPVPVAVGIRDKGTCEVRIPAERFDSFALLELIERHGATVH